MAARPDPDLDTRPLARGMRWLFLVFCLAVTTAGTQLFVLTERTDDLFAWTIKPPLTAAFLGASYFAALPMVLLAWRARSWADARIGLFGVFVFTGLTLVATVIHRDRFHFDSPDVTAQVAAWGWMAIYVVIPLAAILALRGQLGTAGADPPVTAPAPAWITVTLSLQGALLLAIGIALFVAPEKVARGWPWALSALTGRAVAAWLIGIGVHLGHAACERDLRRTAPFLAAAACFALLQPIALARYPGDVDWHSAGAWLWVAFLASVFSVAAGAGRRLFAPAIQASPGDR